MNIHAYARQKIINNRMVMKRAPFLRNQMYTEITHTITKNMQEKCVRNQSFMNESR